MPALLEPPLYYADGQIRDEVYVYGSFLQSRMYRAGVVCSDCHNPHSLALKAPGNGVCAQCHKPAEFDTPRHHHHKPGSAGAQCAECHMPETTYMGVDPRRDHSLRIPRPDLSVVMDVPNACNRCHSQQSADWAVSALSEWGIVFTDTARHPARAQQRFLAGDSRAAADLLAIAADPQISPIRRATAMAEAGGAAPPGTVQTASLLLRSDNTLLRLGAVRGLQSQPPEQRLRLLEPLITDPVTAIRMAVAVALAPLPLEQLDSKQAGALSALFSEYESILDRHADSPERRLQLGDFLTARGRFGEAETAYRQALKLSPILMPALLNLADLMRATNRDPQARELLEKGLEHIPDNGTLLHTLGLLEVRSGNSAQALEYLGRAAGQEVRGTRHRFVYAVALHDLGQPKKAITQLKSLVRDVPGDLQALRVLVNYLLELGRREEAQVYARKLQ